MIPFDVHMGKHRASITFDSLVWFFVVTTAATVAGALIYDKWVSPYLASLPNLPNSLLPTQPAPAALPNVVSVQNPNGNA